MNFVVIGSSRGLGLSLTECLLREGHNVAAIARKTSERLQDLIISFPEKLYYFSGDVCDEKAIKEAAAQAASSLGEIDSVCNCAGVLLPHDRQQLLYNCDIEELRQTLDTNIVGAVIVIKAFYPYVKKGGRFFTITSEGVSLKSCGTWVPCYSLSKTAETKISGIMNASTKDINFFSVHPGRMNTDMGRTTAQIEPEVSAKGLMRLMTGQQKISRDEWYIDYLGNVLKT